MAPPRQHDLAARVAIAAVALLAMRPPAGAARLVAQEPAPPQATPSIGAIAADRLEALDRRLFPALTRSDLLFQNLSRYFATYVVPSDSEALVRFLVTLEDVTRRLSSQVVGSAGELARREGAPRLGVEHLRTAFGALLPREATPYEELVFFPHAPEGRRVAIETYDLAAFADTGFSLGALLSLEQSGAAPAMLPDGFGEAEVVELASVMDTLALLVLRLAGSLAQAERVPELTVDHLHRAAAELAERSRARAPAAAEPPPSAAGRLFADVTDASGIAFRHVSAPWLARFRRYGPAAPSFSGSGVAAGDLDGDGWPDLVFCGGDGCRAFRNRGDGAFADVTDRLGIRAAGEARMPVLADFDNDGWTDLFVSYARDSSRLFRNLGTGRFADVTAGSGLAGESDMFGPVTVFDADGDGLLDVYVGNFGDYLQGNSPYFDDSRNALPDRLFRNLGGMRFRDASREGNVANTGWTQAVSHADLDRDGDQDVYVANDFGRNDVLLNDGRGVFRSVGREAGGDDPGHGMNVAFAQLNADDRPDVYVSNIWKWNLEQRRVIETNTLLLSRPSPEGVAFEPFTHPSLLAHDTGWAWAALFFDAENDGDDDLYMVNGYTSYWPTTQIRLTPEGREYRINNGGESNVLFLNRGALPFEPVAESGAELPGVNSRGLALLDYDADGDLDLAVSTFHSRARLFRNDFAASGRWLAVRLAGDPARGSSLDAIGGEVTATDGAGLRAWKPVTGGEGYMSMSTLTAELGLGRAERVEVRVRWPGGGLRRLVDVPADHRLTVVQ